MTTNRPQQIVFIDSRVPDIQNLINGVEPGGQAFVLDSNRDGVQQIADILVVEKRTDLLAISIVAHGAPSALAIGSAVLDRDGLASRVGMLAQIGAALRAGGGLLLYACNVAQGVSGRRFIADLSRYAGAHVAAATHYVGSSALGGNWTLDACIGRIDASNPFTAQAQIEFPSLLATWNGGPDYNTAGNWTPNDVPDDAGESAIFDATGNATVTLSASVAPDSWTFTAAAQSYTISGSAVDFSLAGSSGGGIVNNSSLGVTQTIQNDIGGIGGVTQDGAGTLALSGNNTYSGGTTITAGILQLDSIAGLGSGDVTMNGGTLESAVSATLINNLIFNTSTSSTVSAVAGQTLTFGPNGGSSFITLGDASTATFGTATDTGTVVIASDFNNVFASANIVVAGGTLRAGSFALGDAASFITSTTVDAGATLDFNDQLAAVHILLGAGTVVIGTDPASSLLLSSGDNTTGNFSSDLFSGVIKGPGSVELGPIGSGGGETILTGANTYSGGTRIQGNTILQLGDGGTTGSIPGDVTFLTPDPSITTTPGSLVFDRSNTYAFVGTISGPGSVTQAGTGTTTLSGNNSYSGGTVLQDGTLDLAASGAAGTSTITFETGSQTLRIEDAALSVHTFGNTIDAFCDRDVIDLPGLVFMAGATATYDGTSHTLTVTSNAVNDFLTLTNPAGTNFNAINDGSGGTEVVLGDPPTLLVTPVANATWTEEQTSPSTSQLITNASASDPDDVNLASATVSISDGFFAGDTLTFVNNNNIVGSYNSSTGVLVFTGTDSFADYDTALQSVRYNGGENPTDFSSDTSRTLTWTVNDGPLTSAPATSTVSVVNINDPPTLSNVATTAAFTEEGGAVTLSSAVSVSDPDDVNLSGATVKIAGGTFAGDGDVLAATIAGTSITASYNSSTETLTLSGSDTLAHYQSVLDSVTFNGGENPTDYGSNPTRTLTWTLTDPSGTANGGVNVSTPVTSTVSITNVNDAPTLSNVAPLVGFVPQHTITISPATSVSDPDNLTLTNATVKITGGSFAGDGDVLAANTAGTGIVASYNSSTETLTLSGTDTLAHYQSVLDSVTFSSGSNPSNGNLNRTRTVSWVVNDGSGSNNLSTAATTTISIGGSVRNDFDGDNKSDLLLQNVPFSGHPDVMVELLNGTSIASSATITTPVGWTVEASGDFNNDNKADIILQNNDGTPQIWLMNGTSVTSTVTLVNPGASWHVIAAADFNADGNTDILWQNNDGAAAIWLMNGTTLVAGGVLPVNPGPSWHLIGAGDVNGDGKADLLWQNNDGTPAIWEMNGTSIIGGGLLLNPGASWHAIGLGDFNGDGKADILWQNADGTPAIWELNGTSIIGGGLLLNPGASWHVIGPSDFNGDARSDAGGRAVICRDLVEPPWRGGRLDLDASFVLRLRLEHRKPER